LRAACAKVFRVRRVLRSSALALAALGGLAAVVAVVWAIDLRRNDGRVARNVTLAGTPVGGLSEPRLHSVVDQVSTRYHDARVEVRAPGGGFTTDTRALGVRVSSADTLRAVMRVGRTGSLVTRFHGWALAFLGPRPAPVKISVDASSAYQVVAAQDPGPRRPAVEPKVAFADGAFVAVPGKPGRGIDPADVIDELPEAARGGLPIVVTVDRGEVEPRFPLSHAERLAGQAQTRVSAPLPVQAGKATATVPLATVRSWVTSEATDAGLRLLLDGKKAVEDLEKRLPDAGDPPVEAQFTVTGDDTVQILPGRDGTRCCEAASADLVEQAVLGVRAATPLTLPLRTAQPTLTTEEARRLEVGERVSSFTTRHAGGQPRVRNIHRVADLMRGQVIRPGETLSVNEVVGRRTVERGFVNAPIIEEGRFTEGVGGGVSQFATTMFNAAFLAGLDFVEYQSHSIYISRYPYGREATLNYPKPDLRIRNPTPYGVLVWPTYDATSITVTLYSKRYVEVAQTGQTRAQQGNCTRVTTERTRTFLADGRKEVDRVYATYRPGEGVNC
jgi:vancomycin resistance protein YoaR